MPCWLKTPWHVGPGGLCFLEAPWQRLWFLRWKTCCLSSEGGPWSSRCGSSTSGCCPRLDFWGRYRWCCASPVTPNSGDCQTSRKVLCDPGPFVWTWRRERRLSAKTVCAAVSLHQIYYSCVMSHTLVDICFSRIEKLKFVTTEGTPFFLVGDENADYRSSISPSSLILQSLLSYFQHHAR